MGVDKPLELLAGLRVGVFGQPRPSLGLEVLEVAGG
jgi:hypothetical protein